MEKPPRELYDVDRLLASWPSGSPPPEHRAPGIPDFFVRNEEKACWLMPLTQDAHRWVDDHLPLMERRGVSVRIENADVRETVRAIRADGLTVRRYEEFLRKMR